MEKNEKDPGHYAGFWIDWYDDLLAGEKKDIEFYTNIIKPENAPVLEVACGTGRVLTSLLKSGVACDGLDISGPMLDICRQKFKKEQIKSDLFQQDVSIFDINKKYKTIFISGGSFQMLSTTELAIKALGRIYHHLQKGGSFICDLWIPWDEIIDARPNVWKTGRVATRPNGEKLVVTYSKVFDLKNQQQNAIFKYELYKDNNLEKTHIDEIKLKWFGVEEFKYLLEKAGFSNVSVEERPMMTSHGISTVYIAGK